MSSMHVTTFHPWAQRRARIAEIMRARGGGVAIIAAAPERTRNADTPYAYRQDSHFSWLCGFPETDAVLVIRTSHHGVSTSTLFCRTADPERAVWEGASIGPEAAAQRFALDEALPIDTLDDTLPQWLANQAGVFTLHGHDAALEQRLQGWLNKVRQGARTGLTTPASMIDLRPIVEELRLIKDESEIGVMRAAANITAAAHRRAMRAARHGVMEYEIEAELHHEFRRRGAQAPAYPSIVAGGANTCILHYIHNDQALVDGELVLIDAGCELNGYASDVTRTFPVNGRFNTAQRQVYEIVLAAQEAAIAAVRPGASFMAPHDAAVTILIRGLIDLGLIDGPPEAALDAGTFRRFYMHRTSHWLGMDVHDCGDYRVPGSLVPPDGTRPWRTLEPGMVLTIEPGLYLRAGDGVPEALANIGVRIEDDVLVTANGHEVLSAQAPKRVADIEALMAQA